MTEDDAEFEFFKVVSIDSLLAYKNKFYLQVHLDKCAYKIIDNRMIDYLGVNPFETNEDWLLINSSHKCCIMIELI